MSDPLSIKLFLPKGNPELLRTAEISNWSGKAIACSRAELADFNDRQEATRPGVYILIGTDSDSGDSAVYIGEAEELRKRLKQHLTSKDYWVQVIAFVSKDENLTKAHVKYLEGKLIDKALEARRALVKNNQSSGAKLPEAEEAEMNVFLSKMLQLLPVLGTDIFRPPADDTAAPNEKLICTIKGLKAYGKRTANGFVVFKDSQAVLKHLPSAVWTRKKREELIAAKILAQQGSCYVFSKDHEFGSPSTAGAVVRGGATNGLTAWKTQDGRTLKDLEAQMD